MTRWELVNPDFRELDNRFEFTGIAKRERDPWWP